MVGKAAAANVIRLSAWVTLIAAFVFGQIAGRTDYAALLADALPGEQIRPADDLADSLPLVFYRERGKLQSPQAIVIAEGEGYGGPFIIAATARKTEEGGAKLSDLVLLDHKDSPAFVERLRKQHFFRQFQNKPVTDNFIVGEDVDGVSGATISARGFTRAVGDAVHLGAERHLEMPVTWEAEGWSPTLDEYGLILLILVVFYHTYRKSRFSRAIRMVLPFVVLGFVGYTINASISIGSLSAILLGFIPSFQQQPVWWILMVTVLGSIMVLGRNMYCNKLCPYSMIEDILEKISIVRLRVPPFISHRARACLAFMTWLSLILIFLSRHPAVGSYEPFSMAFALEGKGIQWYILPAALLGALFVPGFWCRLFCPVGYSLNEMVRLRRTFVEHLKAKTKVKSSKP